jgi:rare lipoprotein A
VPFPDDSRAARLPSAPVQFVLAGLLASAALVSAACSGNHRPVTAAPSTGPATHGTASWYGTKFDGRRTASGERYDMRQLTAAHQTLPFGTLVQVTNVENGRQVVVRINDRGPFGRRRVIDLSYAAARELQMVGPGTARVELAVIGRFDPTAPPSPSPPILLAAAPATAPALPDAASAGTFAAPAVAAADVSVPDAHPADLVDTADPADTARQPLGARFHYTVQVGAFGEVERAAALQQDLAGRYPEAAVLSDGTWNRVQVGRFDDREQAETLRSELAAIGLAAVVVTAR